MPDPWVLRKPPAIEVYADFRFEASPLFTWNEEAACHFLDIHLGSDRRKETWKRANVRLAPEADEQKRRRLVVKEIEEDLEKVRGWSEDGSFCVQVGSNRLAVNCLKKPEPPRFSILEPLAEQYLQAYLIDYQPARVLTALLGYIDDVELPLRDCIDLTEYFKVRIDYPGEFGPFTGFRATTQWAADDATVGLTISVVQKTVFRFHWSIVRRLNMINESDTADRICETLRDCRLRLRELFFASFTEKCMALFDPVTPGEPT